MQLKMCTAVFLVLIFLFDCLRNIYAQNNDQIRLANFCDADKNQTEVWCIPKDYESEDGPYKHVADAGTAFPWNYHFDFRVKEITKVTDSDRTVTLSMYFGTSWNEPRLKVNRSAPQWTDTRIGPMNQITISSRYLEYLWYPELEIYGLERVTRHRILQKHEMSGIRIRNDKSVYYEINVKITVSCQMHFSNYPFDSHICLFRVGSYYGTTSMISCSSNFTYDNPRQRALQHEITLIELTEADKTVQLDSGNYSACGFQIHLGRKRRQFIIQNHIPTFMIVVVSWVSFLINPKIIPGRMALLVTLFLCLTNLFDGVKQRAPTASHLNAIDIYVIACFCFVFVALLEYAAILILLKKLNKPSFPKYSGRMKDKSRSKMNNIKNCTESNVVGNTTMMPNIAMKSNDRVFSNAPSEPYTHIRTPTTPNPTATEEMKGTPMDKTKKAIRETEMEIFCSYLDKVALWISVSLFALFHLVYMVCYRN